MVSRVRVRVSGVSRVRVIVCENNFEEVDTVSKTDRRTWSDNADSPPPLHEDIRKEGGLSVKD